jgi:hypothetical protein
LHSWLNRLCIACAPGHPQRTAVEFVDNSLQRNPCARKGNNSEIQEICRLVHDIGIAACVRKLARFLDEFRAKERLV